MEEQRKSAEYFLDLLKQSRKGKFKIYLGMSAGVGKTYRMLEEAHKLLKNGISVKIGFVETHGRAETEALTAGLPILPRRKLYYKGNQLEEMDVDLILKLRPEVVIVDELAHSNIPGSKNSKRWQDVVELLEAGINVIAALNIQHVDSLQVELNAYFKMEVKERVPDKVLDMADELVLIDISVDDLITRLKEGKIYTSDKIQTALRHFFQEEHLELLRELAVKEIARHSMQKHERTAIGDKKRRTERFMVCISSEEKVARNIIRKTCRLASYYHADWFVLYVQTPKESLNKIALDKQRYLINNFKLATELGGQVLQIQGKDIPTCIVEQVLQMRITTLCIGRPHWPLFRILWTVGLFRKLLKKLETIAVDLIILS
ncbi:sensor protein KdpD [Sphingobacterium sp. DK4209]|uniref:Sensor protein KdpD n=1 Tax=Sphingobacterium zhuxiongii TaxID=2662364 RepID=A0A5Q0Q8H4_9SPHI|nr:MULTISPECIES: sensor protein KdpD [unclassified Sphingobacterium]MVZ65264.1 sensor protein KdpD [Sphingobacterium sp. DK4209]QGA26357.1 sensor protein KdpD [Sphingobacterium sp. dk4302]